MKKLLAIFALVAFVGVIAAPAQDKNKATTKKAVKTEVTTKTAESKSCCSEAALCEGTKAEGEKAACCGEAKGEKAVATEAKAEKKSEKK